MDKRAGSQGKVSNATTVSECPLRSQQWKVDSWNSRTWGLLVATAKKPSLSPRSRTSSTSSLKPTNCTREKAHQFNGPQGGASWGEWWSTKWVWPKNVGMIQAQFQLSLKSIVEKKNAGPCGASDQTDLCHSVNHLRQFMFPCLWPPGPSKLLLSATLIRLLFINVLPVPMPTESICDSSSTSIPTPQKAPSFDQNLAAMGGRHALKNLAVAYGSIKDLKVDNGIWENPSIHQQSSTAGSVRFTLSTYFQYFKWPKSTGCLCCYPLISFSWKGSHPSNSQLNAWGCCTAPLITCTACMCYRTGIKWSRACLAHCELLV